MKIEEAISKYLLYSYAYYELGKSLISDQEFDLITVTLKNNWNDVINSLHPHKHLLSYEAIEGSTGYNLKGNYPQIIKVFVNMEVLEKDKQTNNINDLF